jgi:hypothetical protein
MYRILTDDCTPTNKNRQPTRDGNPVIVVSVWKYNVVCENVALIDVCEKECLVSVGNDE